MFIKKTRPAGGKAPPGHCCKREDLLTQAEKTPEPLPHPDTRAPLPCENRTRHFDMCFGREIDEEIFFTLA
jgi:hypothetical protein